MQSERDDNATPRAQRSVATRILGLVGEPPAGDTEARLSAFFPLLLFTTAITVWKFGIQGSVNEVYLFAVRPACVLLFACTTLWFIPAARKWTCPVAALTVGGLLGLDPAQAPNHFWLEFWFLLLASITSFRTAAHRLLLEQSLRWMTLIVLFWSGVQKALHGAYFHGQFLASVAAKDWRFYRVLSPLIPEREIARLRILEVSNSPEFLPDAPALVFVSNFVWIAECALPFLILYPRTRQAAVVASIALVAAIEVGALELVFGALMVSALMLFRPAVWMRRWVPVAGVFLAAATVRIAQELM